MTAKHTTPLASRAFLVMLVSALCLPGMGVAEANCEQMPEARAAEDLRQDLVQLLLAEVEDHRYEPCGTGTVCNTHVARFAKQIAAADARITNACPDSTVWREGVEGMMDPADLPEGTLTKYKDDPAREALYETLIDARLDDGAPNQEPLEATLTMGGPGSGKTTILNMLGLCQEDLVVVDPDRFKQDLVEYQAARAAHDRLSADRVHRESSMLAKRLRDDAIASHRNVCIDGTLSKREAALELIRRLQDNGYEVTVIAAVRPFEDAFKRVTDRGEETGRFVPYDFAKQAHARIEQHRDEVLRAADHGLAYDTNVAATEHPRLLVHYESGGRILQEERTDQ